MNYGVLKGHAKEFQRDDDQDPHSELLMLANDGQLLTGQGEPSRT